MLCFSVVDEGAAGFGNIQSEKRSGSIVGKALDPPPKKGQLWSNSNSGKKSGPFYQVYQIEDDRGPTIVALHKP